MYCHHGMPHYIMDVYNIIVDRYVHTYNAMVSMTNAQCTIEAYKEPVTPGFTYSHAVCCTQ